MASARPIRRSRSAEMRCTSAAGGAGKDEICGASLMRPTRAICRRVFHMAASEIVSGIGQIEGFVDQRKVGDDVADHRPFDGRPVLPRRIVRVAAGDASLRVGLQRDALRPAPALHQPQRQARRDGLRPLRPHAAAGQACQQVAAQPQAGEHFGKSHRHARADVALLRLRRLHAQRGVGRKARSGAQIQRLPAGAPGQADHAQPRRQLGQDPARGLEAVLQTFVLIQDVLEPPHFPAEQHPLVVQHGHGVGVQIEPHAAGLHRVHGITRAERPRVEAQHVFLQTTELRQRKAEAAVVGNGADVAQMIGQALAFKQQRAQMKRARRRLHPGQRLAGHAIRPGIGHGAVAAQPRSQAHAIVQRHAFEALFHSLVGETQAFFQPQNFFADDGKAPLPRLDHSSVHRPDRHFVHAVAIDRDEGVVFGLRLAAGRRWQGGIVPQRIDVGAPGGVTQPGTRVHALRLHPQQVAQGALQSVGHGKLGVQPRVMRHPRSQIELQQRQALLLQPAGIQRHAAGRRVARVLAPQGEQPSAARGGSLNLGGPAQRVHAVMFDGKNGAASLHGSTPDHRRCGVPPGHQELRHPQPEQQHQRQMHKHRHHIGRMREFTQVAAAKHHALPTQKQGAEGHAQPEQQNGRGPGLLLHRRGEDEKLTGEHGKRRHARDRQHADHQTPAQRG